MKITRLGPKGHPMHNVVHVQIPDQYDLAMTFVRMQEWYESPKFHHKHFTLETFMRWYSKEYGHGVFTYTDDWSGFNVPSTAVLAIMNGPLKRYDHPQAREKGEPMPTDEWMNGWSVAEDRLFYRLVNMGLVVAPDPTSARKDWASYRAPERFYLIGTSKADKDVLEHEAAHGRFFIYPDYRRACQKVVRSHDCLPLARILLKMGYSKWTLEDEIHAYALTGWPKKLKVVTPGLKALRRELLDIASK